MIGKKMDYFANSRNILDSKNQFYAMIKLISLIPFLQIYIFKILKKNSTGLTIFACPALDTTTLIRAIIVDTGGIIFTRVLDEAFINI